jgi:hypothetical protein
MSMAKLKSFDFVGSYILVNNNTNGLCFCVSMVTGTHHAPQCYVLRTLFMFSQLHTFRLEGSIETVVIIVRGHVMTAT